jgi:hypothetical protein
MRHITLAVLFVLWMASGSLRAQNGAAGLRSVSGTVVDKDEKPVGTAVVYLKNTRNLTIRTYISSDKGEYHFSGLDPNADYEIHAEHGEFTSANHTVSSLESRKELVVTLKMNKEKEKKKSEN